MADDQAAHHSAQRSDPRHRRGHQAGNLSAAADAWRQSGAAILFYSTDYDELIGCCDRVLVLYDGRVVRTLAGDELTEHNLVAAALNLPLPATTDAWRRKREEAVT